MAWRQVEVRAATLSDVLPFYPPMPARLVSGLFWQVLRSECLLFVDAGRPVAVVGLYPHPHAEPDLDGLVEIWMATRPDLGRGIVGAAIRAVRLTLPAWAQGRHIRFFALVRSDAGRRIARALGMNPAGVGRDGLEPWSVDHGGIDRQCFEPGAVEGLDRPADASGA